VTADGRARAPCKGMRRDGREMGHDCTDPYCTAAQMVVVGVKREIDIGLRFLAAWPGGRDVEHARDTPEIIKREMRLRQKKKVTSVGYKPLQSRQQTEAGSSPKTHPDSFQNMMTSRMNTMAATGAYCRSIAWKLMFRAALRYFSDSDRSDVDRCDIPVMKGSDGEVHKRLG